MVSTFSRQDQNYKNEDLNQPSKEGRFGKYGGQYVPETLMPALFELETAASNAWKDKLFVKELNHLLKTYVGRETPLYEAKRLTEHYKTKQATPRIWLKREDLNHTGAHKINNALGQALLAIRMGKKRIIAETGALTAGGNTFPTSNGSIGQALIGDGAGNISWGDVATTGLQPRKTASVTQSIASGAAANVSISTAKGFALYSIQTSHAAWVTLYTDTASRTADAGRLETTDPTPGSGVLSEVITTGAVTQLITPGTICFNSSPTATTYAKIVNKSGSTANVQVTLTYLQLEA